MSSCCVAPESSLYLTFILPSARMLTTTGGVCCCGAAPPTVGRLTMEGATSGAVTMKMTSSTSMTSMYGTTLMSAIARRERPPRMLERLVEPAIEYSLMRLALQNVRKLFDEGLEADREAIDVVCVAIVGDHGRDRGEQADRGRRQRFGNAGRDVGERRLLHVGEAAEGVHDPPHRTEQANIRADRADGREEREVGFEHVHFPLERGAHRTAGAVEDRARIVQTLFLALQKLAHAGLEDTLERADGVTVVGGALVERLQVAARPEIAFETFSLRVCGESQTTCGR